MNAVKSVLHSTRGLLSFLLCMFFSGYALAATYLLPDDAGDNGAFRNCSVSGSTVTCNANIDLRNNDIVNLSQSITLVINGVFSAGYGVSINENSSYSLTIIVNNGNLQFNVGADITADITVNNGNLNLGNGANVTGSLTASGNIGIGNNSDIVGDITSTGGNIDIGNGTDIEGNVRADGNINITNQVQIDGYCSGDNPNTYSRFCDEIQDIDTDGICEDFTNDIPDTWSVNDNPNSAAGVNLVTYQSAFFSMYLRGSAMSVETNAYDLSGYTGIQISIWVQRGYDFNGAWWQGNSEYPDAGENLQLEYRNADGDWVVLKTYQGGEFTADESAVGEIFTDSFSLTLAQIDPAFAVRFNKVNGSAGNYDYWHVDDLCLTPTEAIPDPVIEYRFDEVSWNGSADEIEDSSGNSNDAYADAASNTSTSDDAQICRAASFNGIDQFIHTPDLTVLEGTASMSFWIKTTDSGTNNAWSSPGITGIEQTGGDNDIFWGFIRNDGTIGMTTANANNNRSSQAINDGTYHHIVFTFAADNGDISIYVDGQLDSTHNTNFNGVVQSFNRIGVIEQTGSSEDDWVFLAALVDELVIFDSVLSSSIVEEIYNLQANGLNLDGTTRDCDAAGTLDHFSFSHSGNGINCEPTTVTLSAYDTDGNVFTAFEGTVNLSVSTNHGDWGNAENDPGYDDGAASVNFTTADNGVITLELNNTHAETVSLGAEYNGITETSNNATAADDPDLTFAASMFQVLDNDDNAIGLYNLVAAQVSDTLRLRALTTDPDTGVCTGLFGDGNDINITMGTSCSNPNTCLTDQIVTLTNNSNVYALPNNTTSAFELRFGPDSTAEFTVNAADLGTQPLTFDYLLTDINDTPTGETVAGSVNLQVRPADIQVVSKTSYPTSFVLAAGEAFPLAVEALDANGDVLPSFGRVDGLYDIHFNDSVIHSPTGGSFPGIDEDSPIWTNVDGETIGSSDAFSYPEVGSVNVIATIDDFIGYGFAVTGDAVKVGRFTPAYLQATQASSNTAVWGDTTYVYQGQNTDLANLVLTVKAYSVDATELDNYVALDSSDDKEQDLIELSTSAQNLLSKHSDNSATGGTLSSAAIAWTVSDASDFDGEFTVTLSNPISDVIWARNSSGPSADDSEQVIDQFLLNGMVLNDADNICAKATNAANCSDYSIDFDINPSTLYYGRLSLPEQVDADENTAYIPLTMEFIDEFASGEPVWATQTTDASDSSILLGLANFDASAHTCTLATCPADADVYTNLNLTDTQNNGSALLSGQGFWALTLSAANPAGILQVYANIPDWLYWMWNDEDNDGDVDISDMTADSTYLLFGEYQGNAPLLFVRPGFR